MRAWLTVCLDSCAQKCTKRVSVGVAVTEVRLIEGPGSRVDVTQVHVVEMQTQRTRNWFQQRVSM